MCACSKCKEFRHNLHILFLCNIYNKYNNCILYFLKCQKSEDESFPWKYEFKMMKKKKSSMNPLMIIIIGGNYYSFSFIGVWSLVELVESLFAEINKKEQKPSQLITI